MKSSKAKMYIYFEKLTITLTSTYVTHYSPEIKMKYNLFKV